METFKNLSPDYKIWFATSDGNGVLGDGKWKILKKINEAGSLTAACEQMGITYRRTWNDLKKIEKMLGFQLLETERGGADGGSTKLSVQGHKLVNAFDNFHQRMDKFMQAEFQNLVNELVND
jgi:molybdate transport system regulatory protein